MMIEFAPYFTVSFKLIRVNLPPRVNLCFLQDIPLQQFMEQQWRIRENLKYSYSKTIPTKKYMFN